MTTYIKSGGMTYYPNSREAFEAVVQYNNSMGRIIYPILGPNLMVTKSNDLLINHDDTVTVLYKGTVQSVNIRNYTRNAIKSMQIPCSINGVTYPAPMHFMFLDEFLDKYLSDYGVYLDIKNRVTSGVSSSVTATTIMNFLEQYRINHDHDLRSFWGKFYFDSDNPNVILEILRWHRPFDVSINVLYDYNNLGLQCCQCFYNCLFGCFETIKPANMVAIEGAVISQQLINEYNSKGQDVVLWGLDSDEAANYTGWKYLLV